MSFRFLRSATLRTFALWGAAVLGGLIALYVALQVDGWRMNSEALLHAYEENFNSGQTREEFWQAKIFKQKVSKIVYCESESLVELKANKVSVLCELERSGSLVRTNWPE